MGRGDVGAPELAELWIGLVHLRPRSGNSELGGYLGAFTTVVARASGPADFRTRVGEVFDGLAYDVVEVEHVETVGERRGRGELSEDWELTARQVGQGGDVAWGPLHAYERDDDPR